MLLQPNYDQVPGLFDEALIRHQVAYLGLLENIRVRRAGYAYRQDYALALARYKMLCPKTWPTWKGRPKDGVREILKVPQPYSFVFSVFVVVSLLFVALLVLLSFMVVA